MNEESKSEEIEVIDTLPQNNDNVINGMAVNEQPVVPDLNMASNQPGMEKPKKKKGFLVFLIIIIIIGALIGGYFILNNSDKKKTTDEPKTVKKEEPKEEEKAEEPVGQNLSNIKVMLINEALNKNKTIAYFLNKATKYEDITNSQLLLSAVSSLASNESFTAEQLNTELVKTVFGNKTLTHENIKILDEETILYNYDSTTKTYTVNPSATGSGSCADTIYAKHLVSAQLIDTKYVLKYQYLFGQSCETISLPIDLFGIAPGAKESEKITTIEGTSANVETFIKEESQKYLDSNYETIKTKLATYTYTLIKENERYYLTDYEVK